MTKMIFQGNRIEKISRISSRRIGMYCNSSSISHMHRGRRNMAVILIGVFIIGLI